MGEVLDLLAFRERKGRQSSGTGDAAHDTIVIERLPTGELAYALNGIFTTSRRLSAQAMTKVLDRVLED
ncbi:hypothetical protein [Cupriavidus sp. 2SB]|uniref:hypothetical protein n=1 Tax=Cupriavidus sp. 2SB TaxID=2502199 RepID=UPI0010F55EF3|nr:hypothetical protein [Cupriavidus sp. 2SB]